VVAVNTYSGPLPLQPTLTTASIISEDCCYCVTCDMRAGAISAHGNDLLSDINDPLLILSTVATGDMTSDDHCYCWTRGTSTIATSAHNNDGLYDIR
jgi:hypothetical protein